MYSTIIASCLVLASLSAAQTSTKCNPLTSSCPANPGLSAASYSVDFTKGANSDWTGSTTASYSGQGAALPVGSASDNPSLYSSFYFLFGRVEAKIQAAPGVGIVSSLVLLSDDLDEIDWEWLGGSPAIVQTNYFGKGNTTTYDREQNANVAAATSSFHTYAIDWTSSAITWYIDGTAVRTLNYADAVGGKNYPQTPCRVGFGAWPAGASPNEGTRQWAGGAPDFSQGPFVMYTQSISIVNYNPAGSYQYGDQSGSYQSIQVLGGKSSSVVGSGSNANANANSESSVTTTQSSASHASTLASAAASSSGASSGSSTANSTTISTKTSTSSRSATTVLSSTTNHASTSHASTSAAASASPSTAPNAASTTFTNTEWISGTLVSILALTFGMAML